MDNQTEKGLTSIHDNSDRMFVKATSSTQEATSGCSDQPILQEGPKSTDMLAKDSESRQDALDPGASAMEKLVAITTALAGLGRTGDYDRDCEERSEVYRRFWGSDLQEKNFGPLQMVMEDQLVLGRIFKLSLQVIEEMGAAEIEMRSTIESSRRRTEKTEAHSRQLEEHLVQERALRIQLEEAAEKDRGDSKSTRKRLKKAEQALVEVRKTGAESLVRVKHLEKALRDAEAPAAQAGIELSRTQKGTASRLVRISEPEDVPAREPTALDSQETSNKVDKLKRQLESEVNSHKLAQATLRQAERHLKSSQTAEETLRIDNKRLRDEIRVLETTGLSSHISLAKHITASHELAALRRLLLQERRAVKSVQMGKIDGRLGSIEAGDDGERSRDGHASGADRVDRIKGGRRFAVEKASLKRKYNELKADRNKWRDLFDGLQHTFEGK